jgi:hypothetical protein
MRSTFCCVWQRKVERVGLTWPSRRLRSASTADCRPTAREPRRRDLLATRNAVPCTTVARTIVDLAAVLAPRRLEWALGQAEVLRLYDRKEI